MSKAIKRIALIAVSLIMAACLTLGLVACAKSYTITIEPSQHGTVTSDVSTAKENDEVTLTVTPDNNYHLDVLKVNDEPLTVNGTTAKFTMPAEDVTVTATFAEDEPVVVIPDNAAKEALPSSASITLTSTAPAGGGTATSHWSIVYGTSGLEVTVYVEDAKVVDGKDAVSLYVGRKGFDYTALTSVNYGVKVGADGSVEQYAVSSGAYATTTDGAFTASGVYWTNNTDAVAGYKVTVAIAYDKLGLTAATDAEGEVTVLPVLHNGDSTGSAFGATTKYYGDHDKDNPGSYEILVEDNTLEGNPYADGMGQLGSSSTITASSNWDLSKDYAKEDSNYANRQAVLKGTDGDDNNIVFFRTEDNNLYAKATFTVDNILNGERWGKFGLMLFDGAKKQGVFYYADASIGGDKDVNLDNISGTKVGYNVADGNYGSYNTLDTTEGSFNLTTKSITMAMTYINGILRLYVGNEMVHQMEYEAQGQVYIGFKSFNYELTVTDYEASDDLDDDNFLKESHAITATEYSGVEYDGIPQTAKMGDEITFTIDAGDKVITKVSMNYGGQDYELEEVDGEYSFTMPDTSVIITIEFEDLITVNMTAVADWLNVNNSAPNAGDTITFTAKAGYAIAKLYANGVEITPDNGVYKLVVTEDVVITGDYYVVVDGIILDGKIDDAYGTANTVANYDDDRSITLYAVKTANGVFIHVVAVMNTKKTNDGAWYINTNFEFAINGEGNRRHVNINGDTDRVTNYYWNTDETGSKFIYTVEFYVAKDLIDNFDGNIQLNYAWKTGGETGHVAGGEHGNSVGHTNILPDEWFTMHEFGGVIGGDVGFGYNGMPRNLFITSNGILEVKHQATHATIDGELDEDAYKDTISRGNPDQATVVVTGFAADDGLYLGFTINHKAWSQYVNEWHRNDNIELRINGIPVAIVWINGAMNKPALISQAACKTTGEGDNLVTTVELFIAGICDLYAVQVGMNGDGFSGWQSIIWDGNRAYINANGMSESNPIDTLISANEINLDGEFNESYWTDEVKANKITGTGNEATITVMGVNTSVGVLLGGTIVHKKPINEHIVGDGGAWWNYFGIELRLGGDLTQIAACVYESEPNINHCRSFFKTESNEDGTYTTTFEIFVTHYTSRSDLASGVKLALGGVLETGFTWIFGNEYDLPDNAGKAVNSSHVITTEGIKAL